jgi:hypothetical protein
MLLGSAAAERDDAHVEQRHERADDNAAIGCWVAAP